MPLFELVMLIVDCVLSLRNMCIFIFIISCFDISIIDHNQSRPLQYPPDCTQLINYHGDWVGKLMVIVALGGSCGDIGTIVERRMKQGHQEYQVGWNHRQGFWYWRVLSILDLLNSIPIVVGYNMIMGVLMQCLEKRVLLQLMVGCLNQLKIFGIMLCHNWGFLSG